MNYIPTDAARLNQTPAAPLSSKATIDSVEFFVRFPPRGLGKKIYQAIGRRIEIKQCWSTNEDGERVFQGVRVPVNHPTHAALTALFDLMAECGGVVCRVDVAYDFQMRSAAEAAALERWLALATWMKWRGLRKKLYATTSYAVSQPPEPNKRPQRDDETPKGPKVPRTAFTYVKPNARVRLELRLQSAETVKRAQFHRRKTFDQINTEDLFRHHFKVLTFDLNKIIRAAVKRERINHLKNHRSAAAANEAVYDRYRQQIPARIKALYRRLAITTDPNANLDWLSIPKHLSW